jgi:hypothetical protein
MVTANVTAKLLRKRDVQMHFSLDGFLECRFVRASERGFHVRRLHCALAALRRCWLSGKRRFALVFPCNTHADAPKLSVVELGA